MAIKIKHKFIDRIFINDKKINIKIMIIGTFNPGKPIRKFLNEKEITQFTAISNLKKFQSFDQIMNFYDRPRNRFWKIMDILNIPTFYNTDYKKINPDGLKFYSSKNMTREKTYNRQIEFCKSRQIEITDLVSAINPISFSGIYDAFSDIVIEKSNPEWNTENIINMIRIYSPQKLLVNFDFESKSTPKLNEQLKIIMCKFPELEITRILSPSGAAANSYDELLNDWNDKFKLGK
jgi:hypothetical protein